MLLEISSRIMRTTLDLATPVLKELKSLRDREGGSLGSLASRLLAEALTANRAGLDFNQLGAVDRMFLKGQGAERDVYANSFRAF